MTDKQNDKKLGTRLNLDDLVGRAAKPPRNLVPNKKHSLGSIRHKKIKGRFYYYWVRTEYRAGLPPRQEVIKYLGTVLPPGAKLGPVDEKMGKKLIKIASAKNEGSH